LTLLGEVPAKIISDGFLHDSLLDLREVVFIEVEIFDELCSSLTVVVGGKSPDQFNLKLLLIIDQQLCSLDLVLFDQFEHDLLKIEMLVELVANDHQSGVIELVGVVLLRGDF
jgi:hypothetical protein